jgi:type II secretory pathway pseudopilin PulG
MKGAMVPGTVASTDPARERGFALIEVLVSALILALIAMGILAGVEAAMGSSARERARAQAGALAEMDQERLRGLGSAQLAALAASPAPDQTQRVDKVDYTVHSEVAWVRDDTGAGQSCTAGDSQADYLKITSRVTSAIVGKEIPAVTVSSIQAPSVRSFGPNQGTLAVKVVGGDGLAQPNVPVSVTGPRARSETTNEVGCALFERLPAGAYTATLNVTGYVDPSGTQLVTKTATVAAGGTQLVSVDYDQAARVDVTFDTVRPLVPATVISPSRATQLIATNSKSSSPRRWPDTPGSNQTAISATNLFPWASSAHGFYAGACATDALPTRFAGQTNWFSNTPGSRASVQTTPGGVASAVVRNPPLFVRVRKNGATTGGARVIVKRTGSVESPSCSQTFVMTTMSSGDKGFVSWADGAYDPGVPWGTYSVCAQFTDSGVNYATTQTGVAATYPLPVMTTIDVTASGWSNRGTCST